MDIYFERLQAGSLKTALVSTNDDKIEKDIQTESLGMVDNLN